MGKDLESFPAWNNSHPFLTQNSRLRMYTLTCISFCALNTLQLLLRSCSSSSSTTRVDSSWHGALLASATGTPQTVPFNQHKRGHPESAQAVLQTSITYSLQFLTHALSNLCYLHEITHALVKVGLLYPQKPMFEIGQRENSTVLSFVLSNYTT